MHDDHSAFCKGPHPPMDKMAEGGDRRFRDA